MWYKDGLRFGCTQCGQCCTGSPGYVWLKEGEVSQMAAFLEISEEEFVARYARKVRGRLSLREEPVSYDCVFLKDNRCQVYGARPSQCRNFPWWPENLHTPGHWRAAESRCEGINHPDAPLVPFEEIQSKLSSKPAARNPMNPPAGKECNLYIVRHGETVWNVEKRLQGQLESSLTARGIEQALEVGKMLAHLTPAAIYASTLERAEQTARHIGAQWMIDPILRADLMEGGFGPLEGLTWPEAHEFESVRHFHSLTHEEQFTTQIAPGAESRAEMAERVHRAVREIALIHEGQDVIIVSHGGTIRSLLMRLKNAFDVPHLDNGEIVHCKAQGGELVVVDSNSLPK